jgi:putative YhbY family RNA-binding protein
MPDTIIRSMDPLLPGFRRELRARAHHLHPVVSVGQHGLTPAVLHEIDVALTAHELIKVRIFSDDRAGRDALLAQICDALDCNPVQQIGKLLVLWRPRADAASTDGPKPGKRAPSVAKHAPSTHPRVRRGLSARARPPSPPGRNRTGVQATGPSPPRKRPGKAPTGVPRAAAPRRRRRAG